MTNPNIKPFFQGVHKEPPKEPLQGLTQDQARGLREKLIASIIQIVVQAVTGIFNPGGGLGGAVGQLSSWASSVFGIASDALGNWTSFLAGIPGVSTISQLLSWIIPGSGSNGIFAPLINGILGGSSSPLSSLFSWLKPSTSGSGIFGTLFDNFLGGSGNPMSTFISNLLGTASTASTANTNANTSLGNWTSLFAGLPGISTITDFLSWIFPTTSGSGIFSRLISGVTGGANPLSTLISSFLGTASTASTASSNSTTNSTNIVTFLTNMFNGITRQAASSASQDDTYVAVQGQSDTVVGTAATMEQIVAALGAGTPDADDFERSSIGANWTVVSTGSGSLAIPNSHDAKWSGTGSSSEFVARKNNVHSAGNHQTSTIVLASAFPSYPFFTPFPYGGFVDVWVRMTTFTTYATRTGLRLRINGNPPYQATWSLDWVNAGTATNLGSGNVQSIPGTGASIALEAGVGGVDRRFQARLNGTIITGADITEAGTTSQFGGAYLDRGWGGKGQSGVGTAQGVPSIKQWTAQG